MRKVSEYEDHALECRKLAAKTANPMYKEKLLAMADAWTMLASARRSQLAKREANGQELSVAPNGSEAGSA